jgi:BirA family biotin operon repressor/biotin-[acetyl-CoA-carboxylase] ligase
MSAACVRKEPVQQLGAITLAFGIAAAQALRDHAVPAQLKWPNDVLLNGAKLAGILVESVSTRDGIAIVAGIGVNGVMDAQARGACGQPVAALEDALDLTPDSAARVGRSVICAFADVLRAPYLASLADVQAHFAKFDALRDREVVLFANGTQVGAGYALGVDAHGHLLVREGGAVRRYVSGEVSLRAA